VTMICGHSGPDAPIRTRACGQTPCVIGGTPKDNHLGSTKKHEPCDNCVANGVWVEAEGSRNQWKKA
jgi:hypothetical protein